MVAAMGKSAGVSKTCPLPAPKIFFESGFQKKMFLSDYPASMHKGRYGQSSRNVGAGCGALPTKGAENR
jgi:hypothetical protein